MDKGGLSDPELRQLLGHLIHRIDAQAYWLGQVFYLLSGDQPGLMARRIEMKLRSLKNEPPRGPDGATPAQLEQMMLQDLPAILQAGEDMVSMLKDVQRLTDERRASA